MCVYLYSKSLFYLVVYNHYSLSLQVCTLIHFVPVHVINCYVDPKNKEQDESIINSLMHLHDLDAITADQLRERNVLPLISTRTPPNHQGDHLDSMFTSRTVKLWPLNEIDR